MKNCKIEVKIMIKYVIVCYIYMQDVKYNIPAEDYVNQSRDNSHNCRRNQ